METKNIKAYGTPAANAPLKQMNIERRDVTAKDIEIEILYCGVCHSDLHTARNDWGGTIYPAVPGHEIVGKVTKTGAEVTKLKAGDFAAVGCLVALITKIIESPEKYIRENLGVNKPNS